MSIKQKTVLIVDDDQDILKLLVKILSAAGFYVVTANNPDEARQALAENPPHAIISDIHMEPEDGFSFIESIKINKQHSNIPILVLSALNDFESVKKSISLGVNDYVIKPLQPLMLIRKLRKVLHNQDFMKWEAPYGLEPVLNATIPTKVVSIGETGYGLVGPFKLASNKDVKIEIPEFKEMIIDHCHQRTSTIVRPYHTPGLFMNDVTFVGIGENETSKIRQFIMKWNS